MILRLAVVTEANYPELQSICEPNVVGENYADFLRIIDDTIAHAKTLQIETLRVTIEPSNLAAWLGDRKARRLDLLNYADKIHRNPYEMAETTIPATRHLPAQERRKHVRR